jgi:hypothetical protein
MPVQADPGAFFSWVMSPDGAYVAARPNKNDIKPTVHAWSGKTGALVRALEVDPDFQMRLAWFDFADGNRLVTAKQDSVVSSVLDTTAYQVWDVRTGREVAHFNCRVPFLRGASGISPGGRYLLLTNTKPDGCSLAFIDLRTGKPAGTIRLQRENEALGGAVGIAFAPDGSEVAMLWRYARGQTWGRLVCWDLATGKKVRDHKIGRLHPALERWPEGDYRAFQWLPDGKAWLLWERLVIDRDTGNYLGDIDPGRQDGAPDQHRRFLDREHFSFVAPSRTGPQLRMGHLPGGRPPPK